MNSFEGGVARNVWRMACLLDATHLRSLNFLTPFDRMCFYCEVHLTKIALFNFLISRDIVWMSKENLHFWMPQDTAKNSGMENVA